MVVDKIFDRYYYAAINKYIIFARVKVNETFRIERLYFNSKAEMEAIEEGCTI